MAEKEKFLGTWKYNAGKSEYTIKKNKEDGKLMFQEDDTKGELVKPGEEDAPVDFEADYYAKLSNEGEMWFNISEIDDDILKTIYRTKVEKGKRSPTLLERKPTLVEKIFPFLKPDAAKELEKQARLAKERRKKDELKRKEDAKNKKKDAKATETEKSKEENAEEDDAEKEEKPLRTKYAIWIVHSGDYLDWSITPGRGGKDWLTVPDLHHQSVQLKELDDKHPAPNEFNADVYAVLPNKDVMWFDYEKVGEDNSTPEDEIMSYIHQGKVITACQSQETIDEMEKKLRKFYHCCRPKIERERELKSLGRNPVKDQEDEEREAKKKADKAKANE